MPHTSLANEPLVCRTQAAHARVRKRDWRCVSNEQGTSSQSKDTTFEHHVHTYLAGVWSDGGFASSTTPKP